LADIKYNNNKRIVLELVSELSYIYYTEKITDKFMRFNDKVMVFRKWKMIRYLSYISL